MPSVLASAITNNQHIKARMPISTMTFGIRPTTLRGVLRGHVDGGNATIRNPKPDARPPFLSIFSLRGTARA